MKCAVAIVLGLIGAVVANVEHGATDDSQAESSYLSPSIVTSSIINHGITIPAVRPIVTAPLIRPVITAPLIRPVVTAPIYRPIVSAPIVSVPILKTPLVSSVGLGGWGGYGLSGLGGLGWKG